MFAILISLLVFGALQGADLTERDPLHQSFPPYSNSTEYDLYGDNQSKAEADQLPDQETTDGKSAKSFEEICLFSSTAGAILGTGMVLAPNIAGLSAITKFAIGWATGCVTYVTGAGCYNAHKNAQTITDFKQVDQNQKKLQEALRMSE